MYKTRISSFPLEVWKSERPIGSPPIPVPSRAQDIEVWIDFDGTITRKDVLDELIATFAIDDRWCQAEARWQAGLIGSMECLSEEFSTLSVDADTLRQFLTTIPIDPGAGALFALLRANGVPFTILSDGVEQFIAAILARLPAGVVPVRANRIEHVGQRIQLRCPHHHEQCSSAAAHCKCRSASLLGNANRTSIYIGDGRSDLCPARKADLVFAKGALARLLEREGRAFIPFDTLNDVAAALAAAWETA